MKGSAHSQGGSLSPRTPSYRLRHSFFVLLPLCDLDGRQLGDSSHQQVHQDVLAGSQAVHQLPQPRGEVLGEEAVVIPMENEEGRSQPRRPIGPSPSTLVPVIEGGGGEDDGELVGPPGGVAPALLLGVPEVAPCREAHNALREAAPHHEGKIHLQRAGDGITSTHSDL